MNNLILQEVSFPLWSFVVIGALMLSALILPFVWGKLLPKEKADTPEWKSKQARIAWLTFLIIPFAAVAIILPVSTHEKAVTREANTNAVQEWAGERYGLQLEDEEARRLLSWEGTIFVSDPSGERAKIELAYDEGKYILLRLDSGELEAK